MSLTAAWPPEFLDSLDRADAQLTFDFNLLEVLDVESPARAAIAVAGRD